MQYNESFSKLYPYANNGKFQNSFLEHPDIKVNGNTFAVF